MTQPTESAAMPDEIYACPRGSGTVSGVWTDNRCGDEPETRYIKAAPSTPTAEEMAAVIKLLKVYEGDTIHPRVNQVLSILNKYAKG